MDKYLEKRVNYYLGNLKDKTNVKLDEDDFKNSKENLKKEDKNPTINLYKKQFSELLKKHNFKNKKFLYQFGDIDREIDRYAFAKNRFGAKNNSVILRSLNFNRHWSHFYNRPADKEYNEKINKIFWRGTTTGRPYRKGNRFDLVEKWFEKNQNIDVAFSSIVQFKNEYEKYVKGKTDISDFLNHKYILSVEGNDKDSGLNWKLNSNSLVMMAKPECNSWLMEYKLKPNIHYIELKSDFSDLLEKYNWCEHNSEKCKEIIKNANKFMSQFEDNSREELIEKMVMEEYFKRTC